MGIVCSLWHSKHSMPQWAPELESRTQGSRLRTQKKSEAKDSPSEDRHSRGQGAVAYAGF